MLQLKSKTPPVRISLRSTFLGAPEQVNPPFLSPEVPLSVEGASATMDRRGFGSPFSQEARAQASAAQRGALTPTHTPPTHRLSEDVVGGRAARGTCTATLLISRPPHTHAHTHSL